MGCLSLYAYRITGSIMPAAMYGAAARDEPEQVLSVTAVLINGVGYLLDRDWGLFAHAPVYLLALPGYWLLARRRPDVAWLSGLAFLAVLLPAAGHSLIMGATTPMRAVVAVVPFAGVPLAALLAHRGQGRLVQVGFTSLLIASLHTALSYNQHHLRDIGPLVDLSASGWKANLLFPSVREPWEGLNAVLLVAWGVVLLGLLLAPAIGDRATRLRGQF